MSLQVKQLFVKERDGLFWAVDWVAGPYGSSTVDRYQLPFRTKRDAESFVKAAKRAVEVQ
jgi:hypothetical protein